MDSVNWKIGVCQSCNRMQFLDNDGFCQQCGEYLDKESNYGDE